MDRSLAGSYWDAQLETLPLEQRRLLREHRLLWQLRRCRDGSSFYRARFERAGLEPATFRGLEDWRRLPILRPDDLAGLPGADDGEPAFTVAPRQWWQAVDATSGRPARARTDGDTVHRADLVARALWAAGARPGGSFRLSVPDKGGPVGAAILDGARRVGLIVEPQSSEPQSSEAGAPSPQNPRDAQIVGGEEESAVVAEAIVAAPGSATAGGSQDARLRWQTATSIEPCLAPYLTALAVPYLASTVLYECDEDRGLHWADDHYLIEVLDPATAEPLPAGAEGALVITELAREGSPLLRFWTGLRGSADETPCRCGRTSARSGPVVPLGRERVLV